MRQTFDSLREHCSHLGHRDFAVAPKRSDRTNIQREYWVLRRVLEKLTRILLKGTVHFAKRESPDIFLQLNGIEYGIEITEVIPQAVAAGMVAFESQEDNYLYNANRLWRRSKGLQKGDDVRQLTSVEESPPFYGYEPERLAAEGIKEAVKKKSEKLESGNYSKMQMNVLLGYLSNPPVALELKHLRRILRKDADLFGAFDCVIILTDRRLFRGLSQ